MLRSLPVWWLMLLSAVPTSFRYTLLQTVLKKDRDSAKRFTGQRLWIIPPSKVTFQKSRTLGWRDLHNGQNLKSLSTIRTLGRPKDFVITVREIEVTWCRIPDTHHRGDYAYARFTQAASERMDIDNERYNRIVLGVAAVCVTGITA